MSTEIAHLAVRMKRLTLRHRLAHLRALIRRAPAGSSRSYRLVALLRDQLAALPANENRAV
jgi:hypothetical protein